MAAAPPAPPAAAALPAPDDSYWIEQPTYIFVDIFEYEMELEKRRRIEDFCIQFFKDYEMSYDGGATTKNLLVYICKELLGGEQKIHAVMRDTFKHVTMKNFNRSFQDMCTELFKDGGGGVVVKDEYVISLLAFCIELGDYMARHTWYTPKLLIIALINALEKAHFDPRTFNSENSDLISRILTPFIVIVPSLLFFYVVLR